MLKQLVVLEEKREDRTYQLQLPENANLGELHDVLFAMRSLVIQKMLDAQAQDKPKEQEVISE